MIRDNLNNSLEISVTVASGSFKDCSMTTLESFPLVSNLPLITLLSVKVISSNSPANLPLTMAPLIIFTGNICVSGSSTPINPLSTTPTVSFLPLLETNTSTCPLISSTWPESPF